VVQRRSDPTLLVLISLAGGAKHGHALTKDIAEFGSVVLGPGTLYAAIDRLEADGLIEATAAEGRRRPYRLMASGFGLLQRELDAASAVLRVGQARLANS
jgi:DNA-binding PadR family transcriptional regulator